MKQLVRLGIPTKYRGCAWLFYSGALSNMRKFPSRYKDLPPGELLLPEPAIIASVETQRNKKELISRLAAFHPKYNAEDLARIANGALQFLTDEQAFWLISAALDDLFYGWMIQLDDRKRGLNRRRKSVQTEWILPEAIWLVVEEKMPRLAGWLAPAKKEVIGIISGWVSGWFTPVFKNEVRVYCY